MHSNSSKQSEGCRVKYTRRGSTQEAARESQQPDRTSGWTRSRSAQKAPRPTQSPMSEKRHMSTIVKPRDNWDRRLPKPGSEMRNMMHSLPGQARLSYCRTRSTPSLQTHSDRISSPVGEMCLLSKALQARASRARASRARKCHAHRESWEARKQRAIRTRRFKRPRATNHGRHAHRCRWRGRKRRWACRRLCPRAR